MNKQHAMLLKAMTQYNKGDAIRIQHLIKVHDFATTIGVLEGLDEETLFILETAALTHDIGIRLSEAKYGVSNGKYQELEGPPEAEVLLTALGGYSESQIERVNYLIAHHHTYNQIEGMDYQILIEADFLVNRYEDGSSRQAIEEVRRKIFKTQAGIELLDAMFELDAADK